MSKHTQGPWHAASRPEGPNGAGRIWYYAQREPSLSSSCFSIGPFRTQQEAVAESERQNSLLLMRSAAPDMYTLIKAEYEVHDGFKTLPLGYPRERAEAISNIVKAVEGGAA